MYKTLLPLFFLACGPSDPGKGRDPDTTTTGPTTPTGTATGDDDDVTGTTTPTGTTPTGPTADGCPADAPATDTVPSFCGHVPKNVLFLSVDTFRKTHLGHFGTKGLTPFLDTITSTGFVLEDHAQCSNWTMASTTCTLLGRYNEEAGFMAKLSDPFNEPVAEGTPLLATWLGEAGYWSALISANSWLGPEWGNDQGYDVSFNSGPRVPGVWDDAEPVLLDAMANGEVADGWFLHMHFLDPHSPYNAPDAYNVGIELLPPVAYDLKNFDAHYDMIGDYQGLTEQEQADIDAWLHVLYEGEIRYLDQLMSDLWTELDDLGLLDDTLVVVWNDHGEAFWEHDYSTHAHWLYAEENDAFAFFWAKNIVPGTWAEPTTAIDIAPTVLELEGIPLPPEVTGIPVGQAPPDRARFAHTYARRGVISMIRDEQYRLQFRWGFGTLILTDVVNDPEELTNLYDPYNVSPEALDLWNQLLPQIQLQEPLAPEKTIAWPAELPSPP